MEDLKAQLRFLKEVETKEIVDNARREAVVLVEDAKAKAKEIREARTEGVLRQAHELETREIESARVQGRRQLLSSRFNYIEQAFSNALKKITELASKQDATYINNLKDLIFEAVKSMTGTTFELVVHPRDKAFVKQRLSEIEQELSNVKGSPIKLKISDQPIRAVGGVLVQSEDQRQVFNNSLEARLKDLRQNNLVDISKILFEGEQ